MTLSPLRSELFGVGTSTRGDGLKAEKRVLAFCFGLWCLPRLSHVVPSGVVHENPLPKVITNAERSYIEFSRQRV